GGHQIAAEEVGIGHVDGAVGSIELDIVVAVACHIPAGADGDDRTGVELQYAMDGGRRADLDLGALEGTRRRYFTLCARHVGEGGYTLDRPEQMDEVGNIVWAHIEDWTGTDLEEEIGIGMP